LNAVSARTVTVRWAFWLTSTPSLNLTWSLGTTLSGDCTDPVTARFRRAAWTPGALVFSSTCPSRGPGGTSALRVSFRA